jgi:hypothetical protein
MHPASLVASCFSALQVLNSGKAAGFTAASLAPSVLVCVPQHLKLNV